MTIIFAFIIIRLSAVVSEDSDGSNDDMTDEFDNDINNLCVEDDFDLINFEEEARKFNVNYSSQKAEQKCKTQTLGPLSVETQPSTSDQKLLENSSGNVDKTGLLIEQSQSESSSETATSRSILGQRNLIDGKFSFRLACFLLFKINYNNKVRFKVKVFLASTFIFLITFLSER